MSEVGPDPGVHELLYRAIQKRRLIRFRYRNKERIVEPHDYGIQKGTPRLLAWQIGGQSSGRLPGWRWFDITDMSDFAVLERSFPGNKEASDKHRQWDQIFIRVEPPERSEE